MKINMGAGFDIREGWVNVDKDDVDLNKPPYPFKDNSADAIALIGVIDYLDTPSLCIAECWRILKPNGKLTISVPFFNSIAATADIDQRHFFYEHSMHIYDGSARGKTGFLPFKQPINYRITNVTYDRNPSIWFRLIPLKLKNWVFNMVLGINYYMEAVK